MPVITNNHERTLLSWDDLTPKERAELDYLDSDYLDFNPSEWEGFRYKGNVYSMSDLMYSTNPALSGWHGFFGDTFFSGIVVRLTDDYDHVIVGRIYV